MMEMERENMEILEKEKEGLNKKINKEFLKMEIVKEYMKEVESMGEKEEKKVEDIYEISKKWMMLREKF